MILISLFPSTDIDTCTVEGKWLEKTPPLEYVLHYAKAPLQLKSLKYYTCQITPPLGTHYHLNLLSARQLKNTVTKNTSSLSYVYEWWGLAIGCLCLSSAPWEFRCPPPPHTHKRNVYSRTALLVSVVRECCKKLLAGKEPLYHWIPPLHAKVPTSR